MTTCPESTAEFNAMFDRQKELARTIWWIPIRERPPDRTQSILISNRDPDGKRWVRELNPGDPDAAYWGVTHWAYMPEPATDD